MSEIYKYKLLTYGCQMNEYDSEVISAAMESAGVQSTDNDEEADVIIFNTCCVRNNADVKVYGRLGQYKALKVKKPDLLLVVCGCLAQKDKDELRRKFPQVDLVLGTHNLRDLVPLIEEVRAKGPVIKVSEDGAEFLNPVVRRSGVTAFVPISIGCDCFCTFCIVPYVRGRLKSRPMQEVIDEASSLVKQGFGEIFLLGQNVNTYGADLPEKPTFNMLLQEMNSIDGMKRIRFTSPHPKDFPPQLIEDLGKLDKVCESVHLPLQAGSDTVLKRMNRKYDTGRYLQIVEDLRKSVPGIALSTDLIVGFPGETEEEFEEGLEFIRKIEFDQAFMFAYSIREGTAAAKMPGHLPNEVKMERLYKLIEMQNNITRQKNEMQVNSIVEILVEGVSKKDPGRVTGRTRTNKVVNVPGDESMIGKFYSSKITKAYTWGFMGELEGEIKV
jgi:tRNA-2-methylthio-N6-dimethylallyladenosine synthase